MNARVTDNAGSPASDQRHLVWGLIVLGLILRLIAVPLVHRNGYSSDEGEYRYIAGRITDGRGFMDSNGTESVRAPLYPYLLAGILALPVQGVALAHIVNAALGAMAIALVYLLSVSVWSDRSVALLSALIATVHPSLVVCSAMLLTEPLYIVLFLAALVLVCRTIEAPRIPTALSLGAVAGLAALTKAVFLPFFVVLVAALGLRRGRSRPVLPAAVALVACLAVLGPWTARNMEIHGALVPVSTFAGPSFLLGNNPFAHGTTRLDPGYDEWVDAQVRARTGVGINETPEARWATLSFAVGWEYASEHPARTAELLVRKAFVYLVYPATYSDSDNWAQAITTAFDALLWLLVVAGVALGGASLRAGWVLALPLVLFTIAHVLMHTEARYRLPLIPLMCVVGAGGAASLMRGRWWASLHGRRRISFLVMVGLVIALYGLAGILHLAGRL